MKHPLFASSLLAALSLISIGSSGCSSAPKPAPSLEELSPASDGELDLRTHMHDRRLPFEGFARLAEGAVGQVGDEVLFGIELENGQERTAWTIGLRIESETDTDGHMLFVGDGPAKRLVRGDRTLELEANSDRLAGDSPLFRAQDYDLEVNAPGGRTLRFRSDSVLVSVRTYDEAGEEVDRQLSVLPADYLATGFDDACRVAVQLASGEGVLALSQLDPEEARSIVDPFVGGIASLTFLFQILSQNELLEPILWQVIERPSLFSLIRNRGANVAVQPSFEYAEPDPRPLPGAPQSGSVRRFPLNLELNGKIALHAGLSVVEPVPPLHVAAGLIALDGVHPRLENRRISIRLLATRRGSKAR